MGRYRLSPNARQSLTTLKSYSERAFGEAQTRLYLMALRDKMQQLADKPLLGRPRPDIKPGYHSALCGAHQIYYLVTSDGIAVLDILHQAMDTKRHLRQKPLP